MTRKPPSSSFDHDYHHKICDRAIFCDQNSISIETSTAERGAEASGRGQRS
jgi:hypothetical protein